MSTLDLLNAIVDKKTTDIFETFEREMHSRILNRLDDRRVDVAKTLFKTESLDEAVSTTAKSSYVQDRLDALKAKAPRRKAAPAPVRADTEPKSDSSRRYVSADENENVIGKARRLADLADNPNQKASHTFENGDVADITAEHGKIIDDYFSKLENNPSPQSMQHRKDLAAALNQSPDHFKKIVGAIQKAMSVKSSDVQTESMNPGPEDDFLARVRALGFTQAKARKPEPRPAKELTPEQQAQRKEAEERVRQAQLAHFDPETGEAAKRWDPANRFPTPAGTSYPGAEPEEVSAEEVARRAAWARKVRGY